MAVLISLGWEDTTGIAKLPLLPAISTLLLSMSCLAGSLRVMFLIHDSALGQAGSRPDPTPSLWALPSPQPAALLW